MPSSKKSQKKAKPVPRVTRAEITSSATPRKRRGSLPVPSRNPETDAKAPAPAAPLCTAAEHHPLKQDCTCVWSQAPAGPLPAAILATPTPSKSPQQKRAEKKAERAQWTQADIDAAFAAAGGTPKGVQGGGHPSAKDVGAGRHPSTENRTAWGNEESPPRPPDARPPKETGRPSIYPTLDLERIEQQARGGLTKREIAWANGMSYDTLRVYQKEFSAFSAAIQRGRQTRTADLERSLEKVATGYTVKETRAQYDNQIGEWKTTEVVKHYPPDAKALHILLQKSESGTWRPGLDVKGQMTAKVVHVYGPEKKPEGAGAQ